MTPYSDSSASFLALRLLIEVQDSLLQFYIQCGGRIDINALATAIKEMLAGHDEFEDWDDLDSVQGVWRLGSKSAARSHPRAHCSDVNNYARAQSAGAPRTDVVCQ